MSLPFVFLDANIFFAAVRSRQGGSYFLVELAKKKQIKTATVAYVLAEAERNIAKKLGDGALRRHYDNLIGVKPYIQSLAGVPEILEEKLMPYLPEKDLPILLGALLSGAAILLTLDRKHFLRNQGLYGLNLPVNIMTPGDFIQRYIL